MERITQRRSDGILSANGSYADVLECLAKYEDADEQGRLIILPCKVGDTVYRIVKNRKSKERPKGAIYIRTITLTENNFSRTVLGGEFGKSVFLTYEDAEDALEGGFNQ